MRYTKTEEYEVVKWDGSLEKMNEITKLDSSKFFFDSTFKKGAVDLWFRESPTRSRYIPIGDYVWRKYPWKNNQDSEVGTFSESYLNNVLVANQGFVKIEDDGQPDGDDEVVYDPYGFKKRVF